MRDEGMMEILRLGQPEQHLQEALDWGRGTQVRAANHQRHPTFGIVDDAGEVIGGGCILARKDGVVEVAAGGGECPRPFGP